MTTTHQPTVHPQDRRTTAHRVLAAVTGFATVVYAGGAAWAATATWWAGAHAAPDADTSLYGLGYVLAVVLAALAGLCGVGGTVGWRVARHDPGTGTLALALSAGLALLPLWWCSGFLG